MIYITFGQPKSGSTFVTQLVSRVIDLSSGIEADEVKRRYLPPPLQATFQKLDGAVLEEIRSCIPDNVPYVIKTHRHPDPTVKALVESGAVLACVSFRDPRDVALSLLDAGTRVRAAGENRPAFTAIRDLDDTLPQVRFGLRNLKQWLDLKRPLFIPFDLIRTAPEAIAAQVIDQLAATSVDPASVVRPFVEDKTRIIEFNKGVAGRHMTMMPLEYQELFDKEFGAEISMIDHLSRKILASI